MANRAGSCTRRSRVTRSSSGADIGNSFAAKRGRLSPTDSSSPPSSVPACRQVPRAVTASTPDHSDGFGKIRQLNLRTGRRCAGLFDRFLELAHVARPAVGTQTAQRLGRKPVDRAMPEGHCAIEQHSGEDPEIAGPLAQWGNVQRSREAVQQALAKPPLRDLVPKIAL